MAIPNIVPRNNNDGETLGTHAKQFSNVHTKDVTVNDVSLVNKLASIDSSLSSNTSAIASLSNGKADKSTTYTKTEVDTSLSGKVSKSGDTMTGNITFQSPTSVSQTTQGTFNLYFEDKNNSTVGYIAGGVGATGNNYISLWTCDGVNGISEQLGVRYNKSISTHETFCVTPATNDKSTKIATTEFVRNSSVAKSGDTMTGQLSIQNSNLVFKQTEADTDRRIVANANGYEFARNVLANYSGSGNRINYMQVLDSSGNVSTLGIILDKNNTAYTIAPTPVTIANDTKIATTSYVKNQITYKDFSFGSISYSAGTIGTRGYQGSANVTLSGYTPISATVVACSDSSTMIPIPFIHGTTIYLNCYRTQTSALATNGATVRVMYIAN